jgi:hypothetical protein
MASRRRSGAQGYRGDWDRRSDLFRSMGSLAVTAARFRVQPVVIRAGTPWAFALAAGLVVIFGWI